MRHLGTEIDTSTVRARPTSSRPGTPAKAPKIDLAKVASHLKELYTTELSYFRKIDALNRVRLYSLPLEEAVSDSL